MRRMCIACRSVLEPSDLFCFKRQTDGLIGLEEKKGPGRGAYTCKKLTCVNRAMDKKAFNRAFLKPVLLVKTQLLSAVTDKMGLTKECISETDRK